MVTGIEDPDDLTPQPSTTHHETVHQLHQKGIHPHLP